MLELVYSLTNIASRSTFPWLLRPKKAKTFPYLMEITVLNVINCYFSIEVKEGPDISIVLYLMEIIVLNVIKCYFSVEA